MKWIKVAIGALLMIVSIGIIAVGINNIQPSSEGIMFEDYNAIILDIDIPNEEITYIQFYDENEFEVITETIDYLDAPSGLFFNVNNIGLKLYINEWDSVSNIIYSNYKPYKDYNAILIGYREYGGKGYYNFVDLTDFMGVGTNKLVSVDNDLFYEYNNPDKLIPFYKVVKSFKVNPLYFITENELSGYKGYNLVAKKHISYTLISLIPLILVGSTLYYFYKRKENFE